MADSSSQTCESRFYDDYWRGASGWKPADSFDPETAEWIRPLIRPGAVILDVGCGDGSRYAAQLISAGVELHGVDISSIAVAAACGRGVKALVAPLDHPLPYEEKSFDGVICLNVFQHLFDPEFAAREIFRVLRPGGLFMASVPNIANWRSRFDLLFLGRTRTGGSPLNVKYPWRDPHIRLFNTKALADMLGEVGFEIDRIGGQQTNFLADAPVLRRLTRLSAMRPLNAVCTMIGREFYSLLCGRLAVLARKPAAKIS